MSRLGLLVAQSLDDDQAVYIHRTLGDGEVHIGHPAGAQVGNEAVFTHEVLRRFTGRRDVDCLPLMFSLPATLNPL